MVGSRALSTGQAACLTLLLLGSCAAFPLTATANEEARAFVRQAIGTPRTVYALARDTRGDLWAGGFDDRVRHLAGAPESLRGRGPWPARRLLVYRIEVTSDGALWVACGPRPRHSSDGALAPRRRHVGTSDGAFLRREDRFVLVPGTEGRSILAVKPDGAGGVHLATSTGLLRATAAGRSVEPLPVLAAKHAVPLAGRAGGRLKTGIHHRGQGDNASRLHLTLAQAVGLPFTEFGGGDGHTKDPVPALLV